MGTPLFSNLGIDVARLVKDNLAAALLDATLTKVTPATRTAGSLAGGTNPTTATFACKGFIDSQEVRDRKGNLVSSGKKRVVLVGDTIDGGSGVAPAPGDRILIEGTTYVIPDDGEVDRDPAAATYTCDVRER